MKTIVLNFFSGTLSLKEIRNGISHVCVVIILFNTGLYKSAFCTDSSGKLVFCLSALSVLSVCSGVELDVTFKNL